MLTGESVPVRKESGGKVIAGSINGDGALKIKATGVGKDSYLNKVINLVQDAQAAKSNTQNLADKVAKWLTIVAIVVGVGTFRLLVHHHGDLAFALERMVTVMVTACPHALGVAIPSGGGHFHYTFSDKWFTHQKPNGFETTRKLSTIIFDKTGTLTKGSHTVQKIIPLTEHYSENDLLSMQRQCEQNSEHHIAKGIMQTLSEKKLELWKSDNFPTCRGIG